MFRKPFRVKSNATIKNTERRKWKTQLEEKFTQLSVADISEFVPSKGEGVTVSKLLTHAGVTVSVFIVQKNPLFFEVDGAFYPTVYALWKHPDLLPTFTTFAEVFSKLCDGADLMLPGVVLPPGKDYTPKSFNSLEKGDACAVNLMSNKAPVAVGVTALSSSDMYFAAKRGKGVIVLHTYGDHLWALGSKESVPEMSPPFRVASVSDHPEDDQEESSSVPILEEAERAAETSEDKVQEDSESLDNAFHSLAVEGCSSNEVDLESENKLDLATPLTTATTTTRFESMDDLMVYCFLKAWKTTARKVELPLLVSTFYRAHMLPSVPTGHILDVKKSTYKKLTKFLQAMRERQFIQVKELSKGVESIVDVNFLHPELRSFVIDESDVQVPCADEGSDGNEKRPYEPPEIEELYSVTGDVAPFFKLCNCPKGSALTSGEVRHLLTQYIKENNLQGVEQKNLVTLDPHLNDALLSKKESGTFLQLKWDEVITRCLGKMKPAHRVTFPGQKPHIRKGNVEPIELSVVRRAANKKVTLITNLEGFGIDPNEVAHTIQIGVAASTSVNPAPGKKEGLQVLVQGNQVKFVATLFLETYRIPKKYIKGLELAPKKGR